MIDQLSHASLFSDSSIVTLRVWQDPPRLHQEVHGRDSAACPGCRSISRSRHSRYWRSLKDVAVQGTPVILRLRQGRWRCRDAGCERRIFTERLSKVCAPSAQQTKRTQRKVRATLIEDGSMEQTIPYSSNLENSQALLSMDAAAPASTWFAAPVLNHSPELRPP
jgi:transposase